MLDTRTSLLEAALAGSGIAVDASLAGSATRRNGCQRFCSSVIDIASVL